MDNHHNPKKIHFLLLCYPAQGQINPTLQLAKRLLQAGESRVTFVTTVHGLTHQLNALPSIDGLHYASFSDGFDDGTKPTDDHQYILSQLKLVGCKTLTQLLTSLSDQGHPVNFLVYGMLLSWAADVACAMSIPCAYLCTQSATTFAIYHHFILTARDRTDQPNSIQLQGLPPFGCNDLPSILLPDSPENMFLPFFEQHILALKKDPRACLLLNTFDGLEEEVIRSIGDVNLIAIGPLIPASFLEKNSSSETSYGCDLFEKSTDEYIQWLNSKPHGSVVYVSFGSIVVMKINQMEEIFHGLISYGQPFLWVIRASDDKSMKELEGTIKNTLKEEQGLVVPWCSQLDVLNHKSVGCFMSHCGWNSTLESFIAGVPIVALPQCSDQTTNAKMVEEVWGNGIRARANGDGIVRSEEIIRCLEIVMENGGRGKELRNNIQKWRGLALEAVKQGGSSYNNLKAFQQKLEKDL